VTTDTEVADWIAQDPDPHTRGQATELQRRASAGDRTAAAELTDAFDGRLQFGTAGLRGALGPGPNRMNRIVVSQAAAGLAAYLVDQGMAGGPVIVGFDARHNSEVFARDTAEILAGAGFKAILSSGPVPTPVVAFGIRHLGCAAGVVVTASHNPRRDNGYKVYLGDGSQIVPPADIEIAERIEAVSHGPLAGIARADSFAVWGPELVEAYLAEAIRRTGFAPASVVALQADPDPDFPTVAFPNPEEPGAIDLALAQARATDADLVIANDPDADRCAVAVPVDGDWRMLRGDELGALLGDDALRRGVRGTYACSVVSSSLLSTMAMAHGQPFVATLTGFKWIGRVPGLAFGYEEAIGYCVDPAAVPDKDGISALIRVLTLAAALKASGSSLPERLDEISRTYGVHETDQLSVRVGDLTIIRDAMATVRADPPTELAGETVVFTDLATGSADLPPTDGVALRGDTINVVLRPSGTEPKLKAYLEVRLSPEQSRDLSAARALARERLQLIRSDLAPILA